MTKILVTGASGFVAAHLIRLLLAENHEVTCVVRRSSRIDRLPETGVRLVYGDVADRDWLPAAIQGHDVVFHLAGCLRAFRKQQFYRVNEAGVRNVAWACARQTTPPTLVSTSSLAAVGPSTADRPHVESDPPSPVSNYGRSKWAGELAVRQWADQLPISIVRPAIVFGEADEATREIFLPIARCGVHVVPTWQTHRFSLIHADDLARLLTLVAHHGRRIVREADDRAAAAQGCYFAACEHDPTYAEFGRMIGRALGRPRTRIVHVGPVIVWGTALMLTCVARLCGRWAHFDLDKAREARAGSWTCSAAAAAGELGFAVAAPLADRLAQTARWYRENGWI